MSREIVLKVEKSDFYYTESLLYSYTLIQPNPQFMMVLLNQVFFKIQLTFGFYTVSKLTKCKLNL